MHTLRRLIVLALLVASPVAAQEPDAEPGSPIASVQISGFDSDRLSPGLRHDIDQLTGTPLEWEKVGELATRIEAEHPEVVTALRAIPNADGSARVVILVARISDNRHLETNINARYTIEKVDIEGDEDVSISQSLRDALQALVGTRLNVDATDPLVERLRDELPGYEVKRRISRGSRRGQVEFVLELRKGEAGRWLHFEPHRLKFLFHEEQGWSGFLDVPIGARTGNIRVTPFAAFDNADDLVEEYSGWGVRVESREVMTERLGLSFEFSRFTETWRDETLAALAHMPGALELYQVRTTVAPLVTFAIDPRLRVSAGVSASELEAFDEPSRSQAANVFVLGVGYGERWTGAGGTHDLDAALAFRASADALNSDASYKRLLATASYEYRSRPHRVIVQGAAGRISGVAPLFERFTLGDTTTLRGWDKYDIAPAGADRMVHGSVEYRYHGLSFFLDNGAIWDESAAKNFRVSSGLGYHGDNVFVTIGLPLNASEVDPTVMFGVRF